MKRKVHCQLNHRLVLLMLLFLWAGVTIAAFNFHHHDAGEQCDDISCPFALLLLNVPLLAGVVLFLFPPEAPPFLPSGSETARGILMTATVSVRGPPRLSHA